MEHMQPWEFYSIVALFSVFCALAAHSVTWDHMFKKIQKLQLEKEDMKRYILND